MKEEDSPPKVGEEASKGRPDWRALLKEFGAQERGALEILSNLWKILPLMGTPLGHLAKTLEERGVSPETNLSAARGPDLLPLNPLIVDQLTSVPEGLKAPLKLLLLSLSFLAMGGRNNRKSDLRLPKELSSGQVIMIEHLVERLSDLGSESRRCPPLQESTLILGKLRFDYAGEPVHPMEDLIAEKVIAVWPPVVECAVQPVTDFLPQELREMIEEPSACLLPPWEWPDNPTKSRVRASQDEWDKIVAAAHARGLMVPVEDDQVFRDKHGRKVLNGAGAVKKLKQVGGEEKALQRFISNFIPINQFQAHLKAGDRFLPYLGQLTLLEQGPDETYLVDSEDFSSCFNLFSLPASWHRYMCFEKQVDGRVFGLTPGVKVYAAMAVVPMGWINAVTVIQSAVRTLVFEGAEIPEDSEVTKVKKMPQTDDYTVIYLDSYDEIRRLDSQCAEALEGKESARHIRFKKLCEQKGLPLNHAKRVVAATRGTLQGGVLDGTAGWYKLAGEKQVDLLGLGMALLSLESWKEFEIRHFIGKATFGMCFRRPLFSLMEAIFDDLGDLIKGNKQQHRRASLDEVVMIVSTTCLMGSSLRVSLDPEVSCSDASPSGGGAATASEFMPEAGTVFHDGEECWWCDRRFPSEQRYPCPCMCGAALCSLECIWAHRDGSKRTHRTCLRHRWRPPRFGERFSGPHAPLSHAVAKMGGLEVQRPYDILRGSDFFTEAGRQELDGLMGDPYLWAEHWAPECKLFSKARGRPITLNDGTVIRGPQPVRDSHHLMGLPNLRGDMKARLRRSNAMALKPLKRAEHMSQQQVPRHLTLEHPYGSWLWEFTLVKQLEERGFFHSVGSSCCFGGLREKWFSFFGTSEEIRARLEVACPGHTGLLPYTVEQRPDGSLFYPTEEESEYPWGLCLAYARGLKAQMEKEKVFSKVQREARETWYEEELKKSTQRLQTDTVLKPMAKFLTRMEADMKVGEERHHLQDLLRSASMRGTEVRFHLTLGPDQEAHEVPYPALRWRWKTTLSYQWKDKEMHINELEMNALAVVSKQRGRNTARFHKRWLHVLDSMVCRGALAKERSSSKRLNKVMRKHTAAALAQNGYLFPLWTISQWNFSDKASRRYE